MLGTDSGRTKNYYYHIRIRRSLCDKKQIWCLDVDLYVVQVVACRGINHNEILITQCYCIIYLLKCTQLYIQFNVSYFLINWKKKHCPFAFHLFIIFRWVRLLCYKINDFLENQFCFNLVFVEKKKWWIVCGEKKKKNLINNKKMKKKKRKLFSYLSIFRQVNPYLRSFDRTTAKWAHRLDRHIFPNICKIK